jgi:signal transduction histidine kinase
MTHINIIQNTHEDDEPMQFMEESEDTSTPNDSVERKVWKVLVVDDDHYIHQITHIVLGRFEFQAQPLLILSAHSASEAKTLLKEHTDIAVILLDVVMETHDAGLKLVGYIRETLQNQLVQIVLRTGQPGYAPELEVIQRYEINDYANKTELTAHKLFALMTGSLRAYSNLISLETLRRQLEDRVKQRTQELEEKNVQLIRLNQEKNELLGIAAHDLKNPLSNIKLYAEEIELLVEQVEPMELAKINHFAGLIQYNARQMFQLVKNLLDVNRIEMGHLHLNMEFLNVYPVLEQLVNQYRTQAQAKQIQLILDAHYTEALTYADGNKLHQIVDNLLSNAVKYTARGKAVEVRLRVEGLSVVCEIHDQGPGLSQADQLKLYQKFTRLTPRPTGQEYSSGLGLFIVKKLSDMMQTEIECESELGHGTCFRVRVPHICLIYHRSRSLGGSGLDLTGSENL